MNSNELSTQWMNRPADERFATVQSLHEHNLAKRAISTERGVALDHMQVLPGADGGMMLGATGSPAGAYLTHWAFGQLCQRAGAPAAYLRQSVDLNRWRVPSASYAAHDAKKATTLYASDRDMFVCLVDADHPIEVPGTGEQERLFRGFIVRNSEVGAAALDISLFLYRYICDNRIIRGMSHERRLKIRHTSGGPMRFVREAAPALLEYAQADTREEVQLVIGARKQEVAVDGKGVSEWLRSRGLTQEQTSTAITSAEQSGENPRSIWGLVQGLTASAHEMPFGDERFAFERKAGALLGAVRS